jgi:DNA excision repair protein ERCC-3
VSSARNENPLIVQSDHTVLVEVDSPRYVEARDALARFAELVKSPEHVHMYRITPLSIWNACAAGVPVESIRQQMRGLSKYDVPRHVEIEIAEYAERYGKLQLTRNHRGLVLSISDAALAEELIRHQTVASLLAQRIGPREFLVEPAERGRLKQALIKVGYPVEDLSGYREGEPLEIILRGQTRRGLSFHLRDYQREAVETFYAAGTARGGSGVIVLPCGAGKTIVGLTCMARLTTAKRWPVLPTDAKQR